MEKIWLSEEKRKARKKREVEKRKITTKVYTVRVYNDSPLMVAIEKASEDAGKQPGRYLRQALIEKLQRDGYMDNAPEDDLEQQQYSTK